MPPTLRLRGAAAGLVIAAGVAACGSSSSSSQSSSGGDTGSATAAVTIKLAIDGPMTGDAAADGMHIRQGAELAISQINAAGGIASGRYKGAKISADFLDDRETVDGAVSNANTVVGDSTYWAYLGTGFSDAALGAAPVLDRAGVSFLSTYASSDLILAKPKQNVFVVPPTFPAYAFSAAERAVKLGYRKVAVLEANAGFATHMADLFTTHFQQLGGTVVDTEKYEFGAKDVQAAVAKVKASAPDAIAMAGLTGDDTAQLKALHAAGVTVPVIDTEAVLYSRDFITAAGADAEGVIGQTPSDPQRSGTQAAALRNAWQSAHGTVDVPDPSAFTYEAVYAIARALESSPADRTGLGAALHSVTITDTGVAPLAFDASGARLQGVLWYFTVKGGAFTFDTGYRQTAPMTVKEIPLQH